MHAVGFTRSGSDWKGAWIAACRSVDVIVADLRHAFVSRLAENPAVSEETIMALAGHVSKSMPGRYSHIRSQAKQTAIERSKPQARLPRILRATPHKSPHRQLTEFRNSPKNP